MTFGSMPFALRRSFVLSKHGRQTGSFNPPGDSRVMPGGWLLSMGKHGTSRGFDENGASHIPQVESNE